MEDNWLGIPGFAPIFSSDVKEVAGWCSKVKEAIRGELVLGVYAGYDLFNDCWNLDFPLLIEAENHCLDVTNFKFDEVTIGLDRVDSHAPIIQLWDEWVYEWRKYPCDEVMSKTIVSIRPTVEEEERCTNFERLNGIEVRFKDGLFLIQNGLDTNLLKWIDFDE